MCGAHAMRGRSPSQSSLANRDSTGGPLQGASQEKSNGWKRQRRPRKRNLLPRRGRTPDPLLSYVFPSRTMPLLYENSFLIHERSIGAAFFRQCTNVTTPILILFSPLEKIQGRTCHGLCFWFLGAYVVCSVGTSSSPLFFFFFFWEGRSKQFYLLPPLCSRFFFFLLFQQVKRF